MEEQFRITRSISTGKIKDSVNGTLLTEGFLDKVQFSKNFELAEK